jgi:hypothetical protein
MLFRQYGPPLVLKSTMALPSSPPRPGGCSIAGKSGTSVLPECPEYNGSCEAGIGSMKTRTHHESSRLGHPGQWTCDDAEAARLQANQTARPWGLHGPTPEEVWRQRQPITTRARWRFAKQVCRLERETRQSEGHSAESVLPPRAHAGVERVAISRALASQGYLQFSRPVKACTDQG